jgi:predicted DNA binding CopG/RHH family protein
MPSKSVTLRLPVTDIDKARQLAEAKGIGYQTLIKVLLHDALKREERKAS